MNKKHEFHGYGGTRVYGIWWNMHNRCKDPKHVSYPYYGGRGITVCERWNDVQKFVEDMGTPPAGYTIERIDGDKGYERSNCRWASRKEQANNRKNTLTLTIEGRTQTVSQWADEVGLPYWKVALRKIEGWPDEKCIEKGRIYRPHKNPRMITAFGETMHMSEWARQLGITSAHIFNMNKRGRPYEACIHHFLSKAPDTNPLKQKLMPTI